LVFEFASQQIWDTSIDHMSAPIFVRREIYTDVVAYVKRQCQELAIQLIIELQGKFPPKILWMHWELFTHNINCN
jgi:hypothetical protein